jgi:hypothetical protein
MRKRRRYAMIACAKSSQCCFICVFLSVFLYSVFVFIGCVWLRQERLFLFPAFAWFWW